MPLDDLQLQCPDFVLVKKDKGEKEKLGFLLKYTSSSKKLQTDLLYLQFVKVEGVVQASFMSERATLFGGSIGLLGEYRPIPRERNIHFVEHVDYMHLEPFQEPLHTWSCYFMQPSSSLKNQCIEIRERSSLPENSIATDSVIVNYCVCSL
ncbi:hypothetical protein FRX31_025613 [Thalictrum thalictroides]|uniref:Uncharacterized protein n=1 Tax=Thalictrum thalictroides TaxID=46969 RepID=A0A7J6VKZ9_THATH|nr:hypothetical protein FRX31_025613 [Thalictrum thalictroides]